MKQKMKARINRLTALTKTHELVWKKILGSIGVNGTDENVYNYLGYFAVTDNGLQLELSIFENKNLYPAEKVRLKVDGNIYGLNVETYGGSAFALLYEAIETARNDAARHAKDKLNTKMDEL